MISRKYARTNSARISIKLVYAQTITYQGHKEIRSYFNTCWEIESPMEAQSSPILEVFDGCAFRTEFHEP